LVGAAARHHVDATAVAPDEEVEGGVGDERVDLDVGGVADHHVAGREPLGLGATRGPARGRGGRPARLVVFAGWLVGAAGAERRGEGATERAGGEDLQEAATSLHGPIVADRAVPRNRVDCSRCAFCTRTTTSTASFRSRTS